jgi:hypothetical protein
MRLAVSLVAHTGLHSPEACANTVLSCTPAVPSQSHNGSKSCARYQDRSTSGEVCFSPARRDVRSRRQQPFAIDVSFRSKPSTAPSLLGLAAIQYFERVKDLTGLSPKRRFIAILAAAAVLSAVLIIVLGPWLARYAVAEPNARSSHKLPTPQGGGIAVVGATVLVSGGVLFF